MIIISADYIGGMVKTATNHNGDTPKRRHQNVRRQIDLAKTATSQNGDMNRALNKV